MNMKKRSWILIITSVLCLAFLCIGTLMTPAVGFSENENRYLQAAPKLTIDHVLNGRFETQAEDYLNDQIIGRSLWAVSYTHLDVYKRQHTKNQTEIISEEPLDEAKLRDVIAETGYELQGISSEPYAKKGLFGFGK